MMLLKLIARALRRAHDPRATRRAQWAAVKSTAHITRDPALLAAIADAEQRANEALRETYGSAAIAHPTPKQADELCGLALRLVSDTDGYIVTKNSEDQHVGLDSRS
jgi:hypothetical protein